jgi:hypothetical protein
MPELSPIVIRLPASSALSPISLSTRRRSLLAGTPAFCWSPSMVRNSAQSGRSPIFKIGSFGSDASELADF